jgi:hypothetical protein
MRGEPGEEHGVFNADLPPQMYHGQLAGQQEPSKRLRAHAEPSPGFGERDELRRGGDLQG